MLLLALPILLSCQPLSAQDGHPPLPADLRNRIHAQIGNARRADLSAFSEQLLKAQGAYKPASKLSFAAPRAAKPRAASFASFVECTWTEPVGTCCGLFPNHQNDPACLQYFDYADGLCYDPEWVPIYSPDYYECYGYCQTPLGQDSPLVCDEYPPETVLDSCLYNRSANYSVAWGTCCTAYRSIWESAPPGDNGIALCQYARSECNARPYQSSACVALQCSSPTADPDTCSAAAFLQQCFDGTDGAQRASCCHDWVDAPNHPDLCASSIQRCLDGDMEDVSFCTRTCLLWVNDGFVDDLPAQCGDLLWASCKGSGQSVGYCCALFAPYGLTESQQAECQTDIEYCEQKITDYQSQTCRDLCNPLTEGLPDWCLPFQLDLLVDLASTDMDRGLVCGVYVAMSQSADTNFVREWTDRCYQDVQRCYSTTNASHAPYCYGYCEGTWTSGNPQDVCLGWAAAESEFVTKCPGVNPRYPTRDVAVCCANHTIDQLANCSRFDTVCQGGLPTTDLFAEFQPNFDCAWFCDAGGAPPAATCPPRVDVQYQVCLSEYYVAAAEGDTNDEQFLKISEGKMRCCLRYPTSTTGKCQDLLSHCDDVEHNREIVDDYGDPVTGEVLALVKKTCDDACDDSSLASASWCLEATPTPTAARSGTDKADSGSLSGGAIGGIAFGAIVVVGVVAAVVIYFVIRNKKSSSGGGEHKPMA